MFFRYNKRAIYLIVLVSSICAVDSYDKCPHEIIDNGGTDADEDQIVELHNSYRKKVADGEVEGQPKAAKFSPLAWNESLASEAQKIAQTCEFKHVEVNDTKFDSVGQNLYITCSSDKESGQNWTAPITYWFNEHKDYTYPNNADEETGHYVQLVWEKSKYVGCGYTFFKKDADKEPYCKLYVCNYGPGGNVQGEPPYEEE